MDILDHRFMIYLKNEVSRERGETQKYFLQQKRIVHCSEHTTQCVHFSKDLWIHLIFQSSKTEVALILIRCWDSKR